MEKKPKLAQLGLALVALVLIGCLAVLFFQDRDAKAETPQSDAKTPVTSNL